MKLSIAILLILLTSNLYGQINTSQSIKADKELLVVCLNTLGDCGYKAFKIIGEKVLIDTCYDKKGKTFTNDKSDLVTNNILFSNIINLTNSQWRQIENDIDKVTTCDFAVPFEIELAENSKIEVFSLKK